MKLSKEAKLGLIVTAGIALLFWGVNYLKGKDFFTSQQLVYAVYPRVDGLLPSNAVSVNGMKVGLVRSMSLMPDNSGRIVVSMHVSNKVRIPGNSVAEIYGTDLLGTKGVRLILGNSADEFKDGDTLSSKVQVSLAESVNAEVAPIKAKAENLISSMDSVLLVIREVFNEKTKENLKVSFASISASLQSIEMLTSTMDTVLRREGKLKSIFSNLESITNNFRENNSKITGIISNFAAISDTLAKSNISQTLENTQKTLQETSEVFEKINRGQGTLGQLIKNDSLYHNLNVASRDLDQLLNDIRQHPQRYLKFSVVSFGGGK